MQRAPPRRRNGSRPRTDFEDPAIRIVAHHHPARVARQTLGRFRGDVGAVLEDRLTGRISVRQHGRVDVNHDLVTLARAPGSIPWWSAVSATRASASACCCGIAGGSVETSAPNVPAGTFWACAL